jgi:hypothetical protein
LECVVAFRWWSLAENLAKNRVTLALENVIRHQKRSVRPIREKEQRTQREPRISGRMTILYDEENDFNKHKKNICEIPRWQFRKFSRNFFSSFASADGVTKESPSDGATNKPAFRADNAVLL